MIFLSEHPDVARMNAYGTLERREAVYVCGHCGEELYDGDEAYRLRHIDDIFCEGCFEEWADDMRIMVESR